MKRGFMIDELEKDKVLQIFFREGCSTSGQTSIFFCLIVHNNESIHLCT